MSRSLEAVEADPDESWMYEDGEEDTTCEHCGGSGSDPWEGFMPCEACDGEGYKWWL